MDGLEDFYIFQLGLMFSARYWFTDHLLFDGGIFTNVYNNYDKFKSSLLPVDSTLPHMHTHIRNYVRDDVYLSSLQANYSADLGNGSYDQACGSHLETMHADVGSELLYHPLDASWVLGVDVSYVKQRDWDNMIRFTDYSTPAGFVTAYWNPPTLNGVLMRLNAGRYLVKDEDTTIDVVKRSNSGVAVEVWVAISSISKDDYGEGGSSKGFYISILFDLTTIGPNHNRVVVLWTPLTCDDEQILSRKYQFYPITAKREVPVKQ